MSFKQSPTLLWFFPPFPKEASKRIPEFSQQHGGSSAPFLFADGAAWLFQGQVLNFLLLINTFGPWPFNLFPASIHRDLITKDNKPKPTKNHAIKQSTEERVALILLD